MYVYMCVQWVPQIADSLEVLGALRFRHGSAEGASDPSGLTISALAPNMRGLEQAVSVGVEEVAVRAHCRYPIYLHSLLWLSASAKSTAAY